MKRIFTALMFCMLLTNVFAQDYSFVSDRAFVNPDELIGYTFVPSILMIPDKENPDQSEEVPLNANDVTFSVSASYLYVTGEGIEGAYSIVSINSMKYGFLIEFMNARNPSIQGHLKLVLNKYNEVDALIFKKSNKSKEEVYYQAYLTEINAKEDTEYFTEIGEVQYLQERFWESKLVPFFKMGERQRRLRKKDNVYVQFVEDSVQVKKKMVATHAIEFNFLEVDKYGVEVQRLSKYPILKSTMKTNKSANAINDYYVVIFDVKNLKGDLIYMYLNEAKDITSIEIGDSVYWMRGYR